MKPYLVTEDLEFLMRRWTKQTGFSCPGSDFFQAIQRELLDYLRLIFPEVRLIELADLGKRLQSAISIRAAGTTVVSIDQIYNQTPYHLESNRIADINTTEIIGEAQRAGFGLLVDQIRSLPIGQPISLIDDGCYSGETLLRIYELMQANGYTVGQVIVGIVIGREKNSLLEKYPEVQLIGMYDFPLVIDWVCERDFYIGIPLSGRTAGYLANGQVILCEPEVALPYCLPFGDPIGGASIPRDKVIDFSRFVLEQSAKLWQLVGQASGRAVYCYDVPRPPKGCPRDATTTFVEFLREIQSRL